jgi:hypothetical protein
MASKVFNIIIKLAKQGGADTETIKGLIDIKNAMTAGIAVAGSITAAYYAVDKVLQATAGELVKTTGEVEKFKNETGMSAEDSSRLLVVLNDLEISATDVGTAFKFAEKNGFQPTIQSLEDMKRKYDALNPGMERTQFLVKQFGKGGLTLQKFFETGDIAARLEEVNKALLITPGTLKKVQEYKDNINNLKDAWEGMKLHAGELTLPVVISIIQKVTAGIENPEAAGQLNLISRETSNLQSLLGGSGESLIRYELQMTKWGPSLHAITGETVLWNAAMGASYEVLKRTTPNITENNYQVRRMAEGIYAQMVTVQADDTELEKWAGHLKDVAALSPVSPDALPDLTDYGNKFKEITSYAQDYQKSENDIAGAQADLSQAEFALFNLRKAGYTETSPQIVDQKTKIEDLKTSLENLQTAQELQTASWVLGILTQQLSLGGLDASEMAYLLNYQVRAGLISQAAADRAQAEYDGAMKAAGAYQAEYDAMKNKSVTHTVIHREVYEYEGVGVSGPSGTNPYDPDAQYAQWSAWQRTHSKAGGGSVVAGGGAIVGEKGWEYVQANIGGGFTVYNQVQMAGRSAPALAAGGTVVPDASLLNEIRALNRKFDRLPRAIRDAVQQIV